MASVTASHLYSLWLQGKITPWLFGVFLAKTSEWGLSVLVEKGPAGACVAFSSPALNRSTRCRDKLEIAAYVTHEY